MTEKTRYSQVNYHPGLRMEHPFELEEIEESLPGIIECYVPVSDIEFNPHSVMSSENSPEMAGDFLSTKPDTRTKYMYSGNTIGPVPISSPFDKTKFIDQIISYNDQSIEEGWIDKQEVIDYTKAELAKIKNNLHDKNLMNLLVGNPSDPLFGKPGVRGDLLKIYLFKNPPSSPFAKGGI
ncbi:MAG: hypothetical protein HY754_03235 [Nitrospirae bacterium]|nr:hypothetical protein [Nitrospirota bacterium]